MKAILTFKKSNADELVSKYEFYRSATKDGLYAIENKIGEVTQFSDSDTVTYSDNTAVYGTEYYYGMLCVSKAGYSVPSAPMYFCRYKNNGGIKPDFLVGDLQAGVVGYNKVDPYALHSQVRAIYDKAMDETALPAYFYKSTGGVPADQVISGYWRGMPTHWLLCGFGSIACSNGAATTIGTIVQTFKNIHLKVKEKYPVININGYDFYFDTVKKTEFEKFLYSADIAFNNQSAIIAPQPMVITAYNLFGATRGVILESDTVADSLFFTYAANSSNGGLTIPNTGTFLYSFATQPPAFMPIALRPVQY